MNKIFRKSIKNIFLICILINFSYLSYGVYHVTGHEEWSQSQYITEDVVINNSGLLRITADMYFNTSITITVEVGGKLFVEGAVLGCMDPNELWGGIIVLGDRGSSQNNSNQGVVELNDVVIENATCGILVGNKNTIQHNNGITVSFINGGGILTAVNTTFINNMESVHFNDYIFRNSYNYNEVNNHSSFTNCNFIVDNNMRFEFGPGNEAMVYLTGVRGIKFNGCNFHCTYSPSNLIGIYANNAGFMLNLTERYGLFNEPFYNTPCTFMGLYKGIDAKNQGSKQVVVLNALFYGNYRNIEAAISNNIRVESCNIVSSNEPSFSFGLASSTAYKIENNIFNGGFKGLCIVGEDFDNNYIRYNTFQNIDCQAICINGYHSSDGPVCQGLQILCDKFEENYYDIYLSQNSSMKKFQGTLEGHKAGNHFGPNISQYNIFNHIGNPTLTYCFDGLVAYETPQVISSNIVLYNKATLCNCIGVGCLGSGYYANPWIQPDKQWIDDYFREIHGKYEISLCEYNNNYFSTIEWDAYMYGDDSYKQQVEDYFELSLLKDTMILLCQHAIQILLSEDELDKSEFKLWLSRFDSPNMDFLLAECYLDEDSISAMNNVLDLMSINYSNYSYNEILNYKICLNYLATWNFENNDTIFISQTALDSLILIAAGTEISAILAQSILERITGDIPVSGNNGACPNEDPSNFPMKINNIVDNNKIIISPNPTTDRFNLHANGNNIITGISIFDIYGKQLFLKEYNSKEINIDLSEYSNGIYLINCVMNDGSSVIKKVIKK